MSEKILIKNVRIPDPDTQRIYTTDLLFAPAEKDARGRIIEIAPDISAPDARITEGEGRYLLPGLTDLCACYGGAGGEDIYSCSLAGYYGGYSDILAINADGGPRTPKELKKTQQQISAGARCRVHTPCAVSADTPSCDYAAFRTAGVGMVYTDTACGDIPALRRIMTECARTDMTLMLSPVPSPLYPDAVMTEGRAAAVLGVGTEPPSLEGIAVAAYVMLAQECGCRIHIRGISTAGAVDMIRYAKASGVRVSASTSPWYFSLTGDDAVFIGSNAKVYPPLRHACDRDSVIVAIADGTIDAIDSGHMPVSKADKDMGMSRAPFGAIGLQSALPVAMTYLVQSGHIDILRLCQLMCCQPARILGIDKGMGRDMTSFILVDPGEEFILTNSYLKGRTVNCPYVGMSLCGNVNETFIL